MEHLIYEHVGGCELFELRSLEGLSNLDYDDYMALSQVVSHVSTLSFDSIDEFISAMNELKNKKLPDSLKNFLELNNVSTLHGDKTIKSAIESSGMAFKTSPSITRGIKKNLQKIIKSAQSQQKTLAMAHMLARSAINYSLQKEDGILMIILGELEQVEEELSSLERKLAAIAGELIPYFNKLPGDSPQEKLHGVLIDRNDPEDNPLIMNGIFEDNPLIMNGLSKDDLEQLREIYHFTNDKNREVEELENYFTERCKIIIPNLRQVIGDRLAVKLINLSGGLHRLSMMPASCVQLLGAEKVLFMSLKLKRNTPKYGILYEATGEKGEKARLCRFIATKASIAARIDYFGDEKTDEYGKALRKMVDKKGNKVKMSVEERTTSCVLEKVYERLSGIKRDNGARESEKLKVTAREPKESEKSKVTERNASGKKKSIFDTTESSKKKQTIKKSSRNSK